MKFTQKFIKEYSVRQSKWADSLPDGLRDLADQIRSDITPSGIGFLESLKDSKDPMSILLWVIAQQLDELEQQPNKEQA